MTVWAVYSDNSNNGWDVVAVFSTREQAEAHLAKFYPEEALKPYHFCLGPIALDPPSDQFWPPEEVR